MIQDAKLCLWPRHFQSLISLCSKGDLHKICDTQVVLDKAEKIPRVNCWSGYKYFA